MMFSDTFDQRVDARTGYNDDRNVGTTKFDNSDDDNDGTDDDGTDDDGTDDEKLLGDERLDQNPNVRDADVRDADADDADVPAADAQDADAEVVAADVADVVDGNVVDGDVVGADLDDDDDADVFEAAVDDDTIDGRANNADVVDAAVIDEDVLAQDIAEATVVNTDSGTADATDSANGPRDGAADTGGDMLPGAAPVDDYAGVPDRSQLKARWQQAQLGFIDDPAGSAEAAAAIAAEALEAHIDALRGRLADLGVWQSGGQVAGVHDTEVLRTAVHGYRTFVEQLVGE